MPNGGVGGDVGVGVDVAAAETPRLRESSPEEGDPSAPGAIAREVLITAAAKITAAAATITNVVAPFI